MVTNDPAYYNRKRRFSINVMLTVNSQEQVIHYNIGSPGSLHDARVFRLSGLPDALEGLQSDRHVLGAFSRFCFAVGVNRKIPEMLCSTDCVMHE